MDLSLKPIASNWGPSFITNSKNVTTVKSGQPSFLPPEILDVIRNLDPTDLSSTDIRFHLGNSDYTCRTYLMETAAGTPAMIALHIEKVSAMTDAVSIVADKYHLTDRERETLLGISMGLSSKELAEKMNISPNTVKVFLRLIMIKMGVASRGAIIAQILQTQSTPTDNNKDRAFTAGASSA
jgi:DNA-binding CsgD family transcriptional regulator